MPAIGSTHKSLIKYRDATAETSTMTVFNEALTIANLDAFLALFGTLQDATDAITLGVRASQSWIGDDTTVSNAVPSNPAAQRESKLLVQYQDAVNEKPYTLTIPTVDFSTLVFVPLGGDAVQFAGASASTAIKNWVTAFEAIAKAPDDDTHAVVVTGMRYVGRNT
jgi:hypothetical protein